MQPSHILRETAAEDADGVWQFRCPVPYRARKLTKGVKPNIVCGPRSIPEDGLPDCKHYGVEAAETNLPPEWPPGEAKHNRASVEGPSSCLIPTRVCRVRAGSWITRKICTANMKSRVRKAYEWTKREYWNWQMNKAAVFVSYIGHQQLLTPWLGIVDYTK